MKQIILFLGITLLLSCTPTKYTQKIDRQVNDIFEDDGGAKYYLPYRVSGDTLIILDTSIHHIRIGTQVFDIIHYYPICTIDIMPRIPSKIDSACRIDPKWY